MVMIVYIIMEHFSTINNYVIHIIFISYISYTDRYAIFSLLTRFSKSISFLLKKYKVNFCLQTMHNEFINFKLENELSLFMFISKYV